MAAAYLPGGTRSVAAPSANPTLVAANTLVSSTLTTSTVRCPGRVSAVAGDAVDRQVVALGLLVEASSAVRTLTPSGPVATSQPPYSPVLAGLGIDGRRRHLPSRPAGTVIVGSAERDHAGCGPGAVLVGDLGGRASG